jgi:hypothetical protein
MEGAVPWPPNALELSCQVPTICDRNFWHRPAGCHGRLQRVVRQPGELPHSPAYSTISIAYLFIWADG